MLGRTLILLKQTKNPPASLKPIEKNALLWWCHGMRAWGSLQPLLPRTQVGVEGCHGAFNASNTVRTSLFFAPEHPPAFLTIRDPRTIAEGWVVTREDQKTSLPPNPFEGAYPTEPLHWMMECGEDAFLDRQKHSGVPLVAIENFAARSESIFRCRLTSPVRLIIGHENLGVRNKFLEEIPRASAAGAAEKDSAGASPVADRVVFFPQYGTISSLNAVNCVGLALFYTILDTYYPDSRRTLAERDAEPTSDSNDSTPLDRTAPSPLREYQDAFRKPLPVPPSGVETFVNAATHGWKKHENTQPRVDERPIHPSYYCKTKENILALHGEYRAQLLQYSQQQQQRRQRQFQRSDSSSTDNAASTPMHGFGIQMLIENDFDQRNFGGLVRCANAFLVDRVHYVGRRKINVVGAVGSNHYTPPHYLGPMPTDDSDGSDDQWFAQLSESCSGCATTACTTLADQQTPLQFWLLDCGHHTKYRQDAVRLAGEELSPYLYVCPPSSEFEQGAESLSSRASLEWYFDSENPAIALDLCMPEEKLRNAAGSGIVLVVPQEGKLPHISILRRCTAVLSVLPQELLARQGSCCRGLPSQVACAIALQRLSAVLHPALLELDTP